MKKILPQRLEDGRLRHGPFASKSDWGPYGAFFVQGPCGCELKIVASGADETGWEHVSVSTPRRPPNWQEMCFVKDLSRQPERDETGLIIGVVVALATSPLNSAVMAPML